MNRKEALKFCNEVDKRIRENEIIDMAKEEMKKNGYSEDDIECNVYNFRIGYETIRVTHAKIRALAFELAKNIKETFKPIFEDYEMSTFTQKEIKMKPWEKKRHWEK